MNKKTKKYSKIIKQISSDVGACYAGGCKNFTCVAPILKLAKRDFVLISDADETAKDCQNKFLMGHHHGTWVRYDEILRGDYFITAEDFVSDDCLKRALLKTKVDEDLRQELNSVVGNGDLIANLKRILLKKYKQHSAKDILSAFKKSVYKEVSCDDIREEYFEFLKGVMNRFE